MITVSSGQTYFVSSGQMDTGDVVLSGGTLEVLSGGVISNTIDSGHVLIDAGGIAFGTNVGSGGVENFLASGGSAVETIVNSGGLFEVNIGGFALSTTVNNGGIELLVLRGVTSDTLVEAGGVEIVSFTGAVTSDTVVLAGGVQVIEPNGPSDTAPIPGGLGLHTTLDGGVQVVLGNATSTIINTGGIELVASGASNPFTPAGISNSATINAGGFEFVAGGLSFYNTVNNAGTMFVTTGFSSLNQIETGGVLVVFGNGTLGGAVTAQNTINAGGNELVSGGGLDAYSVVAGCQIVENAGFTSGSVLVDGGLELVQSGGDAITAIMSGGSLVVRSGGIVGSIDFASNGGLVQLDYSQGFNGTISGFASPPGVTEAIELEDITFGAGTSAKFTEAASNNSGTLTVTDGTHTANLTLLGQYSTANFSLSSDGHGGTVITDPAVGSAGSLLLTTPV